MVFIHIKKPRLMQLSKTKEGLTRQVIRRESETCKIYDSLSKKLENAHYVYKRNRSKTGDIYKSEK